MYDKIENTGLKRRVKNHVIGREHVFFAVVQPGFEHVASAELSSLGLAVKDEFIEGGVEFTGRLDSCYRACLMSRTVTRVTMRLAMFRSSNYYELERQIRSFPWELYFSPGSGIRYRSGTSKSMIYHTGKLEDIFSSGINERFTGQVTVPADKDSIPVQTLVLRNHRDICAVSLDASGEFLYKRGEGKRIVKAPLRETTAALILLEAKIHNYNLLIDPMCGSGTFSFEAASIWTKTPAAAERKFPFMDWPCFRESAFNYIKNSACSETVSQNDITQTIITSDLDSESIAVAVSNIPERFNKLIRPDLADFFMLSGDITVGKSALIVMNPPYGKRIGDNSDLSVYKKIGDKIRRDFTDCGFAIIVPGHDRENIFGLEYDRKIPFINGGIRVAVLFRDTRCVSNNITD